MSSVSHFFDWIKSSFAANASDAFTAVTNPLEQYKLTRQVPSHTPLCLAPYTSISFSIDGYATVCCLNRKTTVSVVDQTIDQIWTSPEFERLRHEIKNNNLGYDCAICKHQIEAGDYEGVKARSSDNYLSDNYSRPVFMEFCLDNTCNLACVMCNSLLSSSIRKNEKLPPLKKFYDDSFVEQLIPYIPHLKEVVFSGGEPFLTPLYFKMWEKMIALNPKLIIGVVTNGSTLNQRIKDLLQRGKFKINISIDSVDKQTYEAVRCNASFDHLMDNFKWFVQYGRENDQRVNIPVCPLTNNWRGIPELVRFANTHDVSINFVHVDRPFTLALSRASYTLLDEIIVYYQAQFFEDVSHSSKVNIRRFEGLIGDLKNWREANSIENNLQQTYDALQKLVDNIKSSELIPESSTHTDSKSAMIDKVNAVIELSEITPLQRAKLLSVFNSYSIERLHDFMSSKSKSEVVGFFKEYIGK
ncbi:MAG: radical SAM protein [Bacteroidetes bacterium]|nr:radical SAM protein [Bacteroidota bacterium]